MNPGGVWSRLTQPFPMTCQPWEAACSVVLTADGQKESVSLEYLLHLRPSNSHPPLLALLRSNSTGSLSDAGRWSQWPFVTVCGCQRPLKTAWFAIALLKSHLPALGWPGKTGGTLSAFDLGHVLLLMQPKFEFFFDSIALKLLKPRLGN